LEWQEYFEKIAVQFEFKLRFIIDSAIMIEFKDISNNQQEYFAYLKNINELAF